MRRQTQGGGRPARGTEFDAVVECEPKTCILPVYATARTTNRNPARRTTRTSPHLLPSSALRASRCELAAAAAGAFSVPGSAFPRPRLLSKNYAPLCYLPIRVPVVLRCSGGAARGRRGRGARAAAGAVGVDGESGSQRPRLPPVHVELRVVDDVAVVPAWPCPLTCRATAAGARSPWRRCVDAAHGRSALSPQSARSPLLKHTRCRHAAVARRR